MAGDNKIHMPGSFGGLMRYDDDYQSKFMLNPSAVIGFIIAIIIIAVALKIFWPVAQPIADNAGGIPANGFFIPLIKSFIGF